MMAITVSSSIKVKPAERSPAARLEAFDTEGWEEKIFTGGSFVVTIYAGKMPKT